MREAYNKGSIVAVSGAKNSGKTTLIVALIQALSRLGFRVATLKHHGEESALDVPGTDSFRHKQAGAVATALFTETTVSMVFDRDGVPERKILSFLPEVDIILLEGFKHSLYAKIEVLQNDAGQTPLCDPATVLAYAVDTPLSCCYIPQYSRNDIDSFVKIICEYHLQMRGEAGK